MALLWIEGFETFGVTNGIAPVGMDFKYETNARVPLTDVQAGRIAGHSWYANTGSSPTIVTPNLGQIVTWVTGFGMKYDITHATLNQKFFTSRDSNGTEGINLRTTPADEIAVYRGTTLLGTTTASGLADDVWFFVELKITISNTVGTVDVKVNGTNRLSLTSQDTQAGTVTNTTRWSLMSPGFTPYWYWFDDWYILDTTGAQNNDFLGDHRVDAIFPNASGAQTDWTPDSGNNWERVDENPADEDTSYVESGTVTDQDLYNYQSTPGLSNIKGIQINTVVRETDAEIFQIKHLAKSGTTTDGGTAQTVGTAAYTTLTRIVELNPDTAAAWTDAELNSAQFGIEVS